MKGVVQISFPTRSGSFYSSLMAQAELSEYLSIVQYPIRVFVDLNSFLAFLLSTARHNSFIVECKPPTPYSIEACSNIHTHIHKGPL